MHNKEYLAIMSFYIILYKSKKLCLKIMLYNIIRCYTIDIDIENWMMYKIVYVNYYFIIILGERSNY